MRRAGRRWVVAVLIGATIGGARAVEPGPPAPEGYVWDLPRGFPVPQVPPDNPMSGAKVLLGRSLFYDTGLSVNGTTACATCHRQALAFTDGRPRAVGATGETHPRSAMSLANVAYNASLNWADPGKRSLEQQAHGPMFNDTPVEMGIAGNEAVILERLRSTPGYPARFAAAFPDADEDPVTMENVVRAIASFERTLISGDAPYDRWVYHDEPQAMDPAARRGMRLFFSEELRCADCHGGFNFSGPIVFEASGPIEPTFHNNGLGELPPSGSYPEDNLGLFAMTGDPEHLGRFRAPTLRNIAVTAPYMHDGSLRTLEEVVDFYAAGGRADPHKSERMGGFRISPEQKAELVGFLESLTDRSFLTEARHSDPGDR